jgi:D-alanyl-D-alanine carboxypeptidase/D-alanyl-D-alanine-endopeptidase (penicillin-binding protein 4)
MYRSKLARQIGFALLVALFTLSVWPAVAHAETLAGRIAGLLQNPQLRGGQVAINLAELRHGRAVPVYSYNPDLPLMPGSCGKLLTTSDAFDHLGPHGTLQTRLYRVGNNLVIVGGGDPALGDPVLCQQVGWKVTTAFDNWAKHLKAMGDNTFHNIYVDDYIFNHHFLNPLWPGGGQRLDWYEAPVGGLNFAMNCVQWVPVVNGNGSIGVSLTPDTPYTPVSIQARRGPQSVWLWRSHGSNKFFMHGTVRQTGLYPMQVTIHDPGLYAGNVLRQSLINHGITISGQVIRAPLSTVATQQRVQPQLLATYETPLTAILHRANTDSINLMAECLCKLLGHDATGQPGGWHNGDLAVKAYLRTLGIPGNWVTMVDGSGLSHHDRVAPAAFTTVLAHIASEPDGSVFIHSLARPGHGTLIYRLRGSHIRRFIRAKDGHVTGASTISGYMFLPHRNFVFSIMVNHYRGNVNGWEDQVIIALYQWAVGRLQ